MVADRAKHLRSIVASLWGVSVGALSPGFSLSGGPSILRARLDSRLRREFGRRFAVAYSARTLGELEHAVLGEGPVEPPGHQVDAGIERRGYLQEFGLKTSLRCGLDIEAVSGFPAADDYWTNDFYQSNFSEAEIAYCAAQQNPPMHFAARWCAKEALKKCDGSFLSVAMARIEITLSMDGTPFLAHIVDGEPQRLPHAVSLSHTDSLAAALVVTLPGLSPPRE